MLVKSIQSRSVVEFFQLVNGCSRSRILTLDIEDILLYLGKRCVSLQDKRGAPSIHGRTTINCIELHGKGTLNNGIILNFNNKSRLLDDALFKSSKHIDQVKLSACTGVYGEYRTMGMEGAHPMSDGALFTNSALRIVDHATNLKVIEIDISFLFCLHHHRKEKTFFNRANSLEYLSITNVHDDRGYYFSFSRSRTNVTTYEATSRSRTSVTSHEASGFVFLRSMLQILQSIRMFSKRLRCIKVDHGKWMELVSSFVDHGSGESGFSERSDVQSNAQCYMNGIWKEKALLLNGTHTPKLSSLIESYIMYDYQQYN